LIYFGNLTFTTIRGQKICFNSGECIQFLSIANIYELDVWWKRIFICNTNFFSFAFFPLFFCNATFSHSSYVIKPPQPSSAIYEALPFTGHLPKTLLDFEPFLHSILLGGSDNSPFNEIHLNSYSSFRQLITNEQRRIFIFRALGYFKLGAFLEGSRRLMSYKLALHVRKLLQFITILLYSEFPRYQQQKQSHWTQRKSRRGSYLTTLPLHIYWVPCAITRFASVKSSLWIKHLYFLRHLTGVTFLACYCS